MDKIVYVCECGIVIMNYELCCSDEGVKGLDRMCECMQTRMPDVCCVCRVESSK